MWRCLAPSGSPGWCWWTVLSAKSRHLLPAAALCKAFAITETRRLKNSFTPFLASRGRRERSNRAFILSFRTHTLEEYRARFQQAAALRRHASVRTAGAEFTEKSPRN